MSVLGKREMPRRWAISVLESCWAKNKRATWIANWSDWRVAVSTGTLSRNCSAHGGAGHLQYRSCSYERAMLIC